MLDLLSDPRCATLSRPDTVTLGFLARLIAEQGLKHPVVGEIGVGIGATTLEICKLLDNRGEVHIFDFEPQVQALCRDLAERGFHNVVPHGNSTRHWDSYNWNLMGMLRRAAEPYFDYFYIDGAHTVFHDALAFFLSDRLLKVGGILDFDDYTWSYAASPTANPAKNPAILDMLTEEQIAAAQVGMFVDCLVRRDPRYRELHPDKVFRKIRS